MKDLYRCSRVCWIWMLVCCPCSIWLTTRNRISDSGKVPDSVGFGFGILHILRPSCFYETRCIMYMYVGYYIWQVEFIEQHIKWSKYLSLALISNFIPPDLWSPNSPNLNMWITGYELESIKESHRNVFTRDQWGTGISWSTVYLKHSQKYSRESTIKQSVIGVIVLMRVSKPQAN